MTLRVDFPAGMTARGKVAYADRLLFGVQALPGVVAASVNSHGDSLTRLDIAGAPKDPSGFTKAIDLHEPDLDRICQNDGPATAQGSVVPEDEPLPVVVLNETLAKESSASKTRSGNESKFTRWVNRLSAPGPISIASRPWRP